MSTTLTLTPQPATASVLLEVDGAPSPGAQAYSGGFEAGLDSWIAGNADTIVSIDAAGGRGGGSALWVDWSQGATAAGVTTRVVTGLTVGLTYRVDAYAGWSFDSRGSLGVVGIGSAASVALGSAYIALPGYQFVATATSHTVSFTVAPPSPARTTAEANLDDVKVANVPATFKEMLLTRVDANGLHPVRLMAGQEPIAGSLTVVDTEAALTGLVRYDLTDGAGILTSASTSLATLVTLPQLGLPVLPAYRAQLRAVTGYDAAREATTTIHDVVDRPDSIAALGLLRMRTGRLVIWAADHAAARAVEALCGLGEVLMLRQVDHDGLDMWFAARKVAIRPDQKRWEVQIDYQELPAPPGPLLGAVGWTFADVAALSSFPEVTDTFDTFADLTAGPA